MIARSVLEGGVQFDASVGRAGGTTMAITSIIVTVRRSFFIEIFLLGGGIKMLYSVTPRRSSNKLKTFRRGFDGY